MRPVLILFWAALSVWSSALMAQETPRLRVAVLQIGTVNWELQTIQHHELDSRNGFALDVQGFASSSAARTAFIAGAADVIVSDWLWVARQRANGKDFVFLPYSKAVGGLLVPQESTARTLADLSGGRIGIAGGPLDKSWVILRAYAMQAYEIDLAKETEQVFAAPPLIYKTALQGQYAGALNFWHFAAKMEAEGMRRLVDVSDAAEALGLDAETPLLGYVVKGALASEAPDVIRGLADASREAKSLLAKDDAEWDRLRPMMRVKSDAQFVALRDGFRAGIPAATPVDLAAAARMLDVMRAFGGAALLGPVTTLPDGVFWTDD